MSSADWLHYIGKAADDLGYDLINVDKYGVTVADPTTGVRITLDTTLSEEVTGETLRKHLKESNAAWMAAVEAGR